MKSRDGKSQRREEKRSEEKRREEKRREEEEKKKEDQKEKRREEKKKEDQKEKRREEERRSKRESLRRKKFQVREKVGKSRHTVFFQWFVAPAGRKVGSAKAAGAEPCGQMIDENAHAVCGAKHICKWKS